MIEKQENFIFQRLHELLYGNPGISLDIFMKSLKEYSSDPDKAQKILLGHVDSAYLHPPFLEKFMVKQHELTDPETYYKDRANALADFEIQQKILYEYLTKSLDQNLNLAVTVMQQMRIQDEFYEKTGREQTWLDEVMEKEKWGEDSDFIAVQMRVMD